MMSSEVVITCALSGGASRAEVPAVPTTPEAFAKEAKRCFEAGASVAHIHARDPNTGAPSNELTHFRAIIEAVRESAPEMLINLTTGGGGPSVLGRTQAVTALRPDFGTVSMGSLTLAGFDRGSGGVRYDVVFGNTFSDMAAIAKAVADAGALADYEFYEAGHVANYTRLVEMGSAPAGVFSLILGVPGAMTADIFNLGHMIRLLPSGAHWSLVAFDSRSHWRMLGVGLGAGGSVRVGFEDCAYLPDGSLATSNAALVEGAAALAMDMGLSVATPAGAQATLGLKCDRGGERLRQAPIAQSRPGEPRRSAAV